MCYRLFRLGQLVFLLYRPFPQLPGNKKDYGDNKGAERIKYIKSGEKLSVSASKKPGHCHKQCIFHIFGRIYPEKKHYDQE